MDNRFFVELVGFCGYINLNSLYWYRSKHDQAAGPKQQSSKCQPGLGVQELSRAVPSFVNTAMAVWTSWVHLFPRASCFYTSCLRTSKPRVIAPNGPFSFKQPQCLQDSFLFSVTRWASQIPEILNVDMMFKFVFLNFGTFQISHFGIMDA